MSTGSWLPVPPPCMPCELYARTACLDRPYSRWACHNGGPADVCVPGVVGLLELRGAGSIGEVRFIQRVKRAGFLPPDGPTADSIASEADNVLFRAITSDPKHVL